MPYTCVGFVVMLVSRRRRRGDALVQGGRAPPATKARRRVDPGNARRRPAGWRRSRARPAVGALLLLAPQRGSHV
jgi:hypothetical protein